jgi:hypothetical protein
MATPPGSEEEVEGLDEEFLHHLSRGSDLLVRGDLAEAIHSLQRAAQLRPKDVKVAGLLGQACYRGGRYEEAAAAYARLVDQTPTEVAARVNLGLANLKAGRLDEAVKQFTIVLDLKPDHKKAMGYLGLARLESGDARGAREWFEKAGMSMMVARCDELLSGGPARGDGPGEAAEAGRAGEKDGPGEAGRDEAARPDQAGRAREKEGPGDASPGGTGASAEASSAAGGPDLQAGPADGADDVVVDEAVEPSPEPLPGPAPAAALGGLEDFVAQRMLRIDAEGYAVEGGALAVAVHGRTLARIDGLFAIRGDVTLVPEPKRFRGKATDQPFGEGSDRMCRAIGEGTLLYRIDAQVFTPMVLGGEAGYFREEAVFALEDRVTFENGRVPAKHGRDLNLVHLRGQGRFLLRTAGEPVGLQVARGAPLRVPADVLVGWTGALTPRIVPLAGEPGTPEAVEGPSVVELSGDGRVLVDPDAAAAG